MVYPRVLVLLGTVGCGRFGFDAAADEAPELQPTMVFTDSFDGGEEIAGQLPSCWNKAPSDARLTDELAHSAPHAISSDIDVPNKMDGTRVNRSFAEIESGTIAVRAWFYNSSTLITHHTDVIELVERTPAIDDAHSQVIAILSDDEVAAFASHTRPNSQQGPRHALESETWYCLELEADISTDHGNMRLYYDDVLVDSKSDFPVIQGLGFNGVVLGQIAAGDGPGQPPLSGSGRLYIDDMALATVPRFPSDTSQPVIRCDMPSLPATACPP